jgi:hypothetical protein
VRQQLWYKAGFKLGESQVKLVARLFVCVVAVLALGLVQGCASTPPPPHLAAFSPPTGDKSHVYFYQWPTGIVGSLRDVAFVLDDQMLGNINTGEWRRFEVSAGKHKYRMTELLKTEMEVDLKPGELYFFKGSLSAGFGLVIMTNHENDVARIKEFIKAGRMKYVE